MSKPNSYPVRLPLKRKQLNAIGHVTVQWSFLETEIDMAILYMITQLDAREAPTEEEDGHMHRPFKRRVKTLRILARKYFRTDPPRDKLNRILDRAMNLKDDRDHIVHGRWRASVKEGDTKSDKITSDKLKYNAEHPIESRYYPLKRLKRIAQRISALNRDFMVFSLIQIQQIVPPSPGTYHVLKR